MRVVWIIRKRTVSGFPNSCLAQLAEATIAPIASGMGAQETRGGFGRTSLRFVDPRLSQTV